MWWQSSTISFLIEIFFFEQHSFFLKFVLQLYWYLGKRQGLFRSYWDRRPLKMNKKTFSHYFKCDNLLLFQLSCRLVVMRFCSIRDPRRREKTNPKKSSPPKLHTLSFTKQQLIDVGTHQLSSPRIWSLCNFLSRVAQFYPLQYDNVTSSTMKSVWKKICMNLQCHAMFW